MDQKSWLWKKKATEKTLVADKANNSLNTNEDDVAEVQEFLTLKGELEKELTTLNDKLSAALSDCNSKDNFAKKQVKIAQEAIAGWEKAETEAISLKKDLDKALQQKDASEERSDQLEAALKDCMQELHLAREDQDTKIQADVVKALEELESTRIALEQRLAEAGKRIVKLDSDNTQLKRVLSGKDKIIQELSEYRTHVEADFKALTLRADSTEKENASLKYEVRVLEKELDIRNEEVEFNRREADVAQKKYKESVQKIANLESECQRLCLLVRKRLPGPAVLTKMKNEVEMLGRNHVGPRRKKGPSLCGSMDFPADGVADIPSKRISFLTEQLTAMEEENRNLRYALNKRSSELQVSRHMHVRAASRLSRGEGQVDEPVKGLLQEHLVATLSDVGSDDKASCAESWASALISELDNFKNEKHPGTPSHGNMGASEMYLMDDFVEMEKLAIVSVNYPAGSSHHSSEEGNAIIGPLGSPSGGDSCRSEPFSCHPENAATNRVPGMLDDLLKMLSKRCQESKRNPSEVLEDMKAALVHPSSDTIVPNSRGSVNASYSPVGSGYVFQTSGRFSNSDGHDTKNNNSISSPAQNRLQFQSNVSISIHKVLKLLEGIRNSLAESFPENDGKLLPPKNLETSTGYFIQVFQCKAAALSDTLQQAVQTCNHLLKGEADPAQFALLVASNLDWIMNHCFSLQEVLSMDGGGGLDWDRSRLESAVYSGPANYSTENNPRCKRREEFSIAVEEAKQLIVKQANKESAVTNLNTALRDSEDITPKLESSRQPESEGDQFEKPMTRREGLCNNQNISMASKEAPDDGKSSKDQPQNDEITAASKKLAECQETILNLGKQFKALASPNDAALFNKVMPAAADHVVTSPPTHRQGGQRLSLLDNMLAEDNDHIASVQTSAGSSRNADDPNDIDGDAGGHAAPSMAIVPVKKNGGRSFLKKLFRWHKKGKSKKTPFS